MKNVNKKYDAMFFGLLVNKNIPSIDWSDIWYQLKLSVSYFKTFFHSIWWFRGNDRYYTLNLLRVSLNEQLRVISSDSDGGFKEIDEFREPKEKNIRRCLTLLDNLLEDNYDERCGYDYNFEFYFVKTGEPNLSKLETTATQEQKDNNEIAFLKAEKLKKEEFEELFKIIGNYDNGLLGWCK
jgi:hypothetical protein